MFGVLTLISALTSVALAQSSISSANGNSTQNLLIPTSISTSCSNFLNNLNNDLTLKTCIDSLTSATSAFSPSSNATVTKATVTSALGNLCSDSVSSACPDSYIRSQITNFLTYCSDELTKSKNPDVISLYDTIYTLSPMRTSVCSLDDSGSYCVLSSPNSGKSSSNIAELLASLYTTTGNSQTVIVPNVATYHNNNLIFLFYNPNLNATALCTTCLRLVLTAYMTFESNVVYGPGLNNSQLLDQQSALYAAVKSNCSSGFLSGAVQAAGGLSGNTGLFSSALPTAVPEQTTKIAFLLGVASLAFSFMF